MLENRVLSHRDISIHPIYYECLMDIFWDKRVLDGKNNILYKLNTREKFNFNIVRIAS